MASCYSDPSLAEKELGWKAEFDLDRMCKGNAHQIMLLYTAASIHNVSSIHTVASIHTAANVNPICIQWCSILTCLS